MPVTNQRYTTRLGVRKNLKAASSRLNLDINTFANISYIYQDVKPLVSESAAQCLEMAKLLQEATDLLRSNI